MENGMSAIEKLFDENNNDNIVLYNKKGEATEFEQVAMIPYENKMYALLALVTPNDSISEDEGIVFSVEENEDGKKWLKLVVDDGIIGGVFDIYDKFLDEIEDADIELDTEESDGQSVANEQKSAQESDAQTEESEDPSTDESEKGDD